MYSKTLINIILLFSFSIFLGLSTGLFFIDNNSIIKSWFSNLGNYGSALAGVFSFLSVLFVYLTLQQQSRAFVKTQFENKYFELIRYHRDNISALKMRDPKSKSEVHFDGYKVAREIHKQVAEMVDVVKKSLLGSNVDDLYLNQEVKAKDLEYLNVSEKNLLDLNYVNIAYLCVFYGASKDGLKELKNKLYSKYKKNVLREILNHLEKKRAEWEDAFGKFGKYYGGHQYRIGHIFRHLYQAVMYVDKFPGLSYKEKYDYIKILRAQLSTYEQSLLFFNSLSDLGRAWGLKTDTSNLQLFYLFTRTKSRLLSQLKHQQMLITKYNFVKNIPNEFTINVSIKQFYPELVFDGEQKSDSRIELEKIYDKNLSKYKLIIRVFFKKLA